METNYEGERKMDDEHITINGQPISEYVKEKEGEEARESLKSLQRDLGKCLHSPTSSKYEDKKEKPHPCCIKSIKGIRRYLMKNKELPTIQKIFSVLKCSENMLRSAELSELLGNIKANSVSTTMNKIKKKVPELISTKRIKGFLYYGLSEIGLKYSPEELYQLYTIDREWGNPPPKEEEEPAKVEAVLSETSSKEVTITITIKL